MKRKTKISFIIYCIFCLTAFQNKAKATCQTTGSFVFNAPTDVVSFYNQMNTWSPGSVTVFGSSYFINGFMGQIYFNADFFIDNDLYIINCPKITFAAAKGIYLSGNGVQLHIQDSHLDACGNDMWQGIDASWSQYGTGLLSIGGSVSINKSEITNAITGVKIDNSDIVGTTLAENTVAVNQSVFDNDYIGLDITYTHTAFTVLETQFLCTGGLLAPFTGETTLIGIHLAFCYNIVVGDITAGSTNYNIFDGITCGILSGFSDFEVYGCSFKNIQAYASTPLPSPLWTDNYQGVGIYQRGIWMSWFFGTPDPTQPGEVAFSNVYVAANNSFATSFKGVELHNTNGTIDGAGMGHMDYGVLVENCNEAVINVKNTFMDYVKYGVFTTLNNNSTIEVSGNTIELPDIYGILPNNFFGVRVIDWPGYNATFSINNNLISRGRVGIRLENTIKFATVQSNVIIQQTPYSGTNAASRYGIQVINCDGSSIIGNDIFGYTGAWNNSYHHTGIWMEQSPNINVRCNEITNTGYGIWARGDCTSNDLFESNTFTNHRYGIYLSKFAGLYGYVGTQGSGSDFNDNLFNGNYTGTYKTFNQTDASEPYVDEFWYDAAHSAMYTTNFSNSSPPGFALISQLIVGGYDEPNGCPRMEIVIPDSVYDHIKEMDHEEAEGIAREEKAYTEYAEVSKWLDERKLYEYLDKDSAAKENNATLESFYNGKKDESVGKLKQYYSKLAELKNAVDSTAYEQKLAEAKAMNEAIPATRNFEHNEKDINEIFLNKIAKGTATGFSTQEKNYITALAQSCPYTEGKAVFLARALYSLLDPSAIFDNDEICAALNSGKKEKENATTTETINKYAFITPNPTTGNAEIFLNLEAGEVVTLKVNNLLGEVVLEKILMADITVQSLNLSNLGSGNFLYTVCSDKGFTNHGKVTIVK